MAEVIEINAPRERAASESSEQDYDHDPQFAPVVVLPEVEVKTNEEDEEVLLKIRAKLYRFDSREVPSEWKERGTGELKLLRHKEKNSVRIVMRRDKTFKVCANHFITPWMVLKPCSSNEKAFIYSVLADFADEEPKSECLALKLANVENANLFKTKFEEAKHIVATKCSLYNGKDQEEDSGNDGSSSNEEEERVADKLAQLDMSKDENSETQQENEKDEEKPQES